MTVPTARDRKKSKNNMSETGTRRPPCPRENMETNVKSNQIKPPTYLLIAIIVMIVLHFVLPVLLLIAAPWTLLGLVPLILGILINLSADQAFHQVNTPVSPFEASSVLVTCGPYRFTRNPMYLGFFLILLGASVMLGSLMPFVVVGAFGFLMDRTFIRMEENKMAAAFGAAWAGYKSRTRRWL